MDKLNTVICGIDFSSGSRCALRQAVRIGEWNGARLLAVHVLEESHLKAFPSIPEPEIMAHATAQLDALLDDVLGDAHNVERYVVVGHPFRTLADLAIAEACDLLVLGVHGHGSLNGESGPAGSVASKCVRKSPSRVLLVRGDQDADFRRIAHCTDYSETAALALEQAIAVSRAEGASLEIIHAAISPERIAHGLADAQFYKVLDPAALRNREQAGMEQFLAPFAAELDGLDVTTTVLESGISTGAALIEAIRASGADLVTVGTHGRGALSGILMGTIAEKIVSHAPCSVLAVKPGNFKVFW